MKVVLTGGPCGGKTTAISLYNEYLSRDKINFSIIPETARNLLELNYINKLNLFDFQNLLFIIQFINEYKLEKDNKLLLLDRGLFDALGYIDMSDFEKILYKNNVSSDLIKKTYNAVLYFKSIAYFDKNSFEKKRPDESYASAIYRDKKCLELYKEIIINLDNSDLEFKEMLLANYNCLINYKNISNIKLSDIYSKGLINNMRNNLIELLNENNISDEIKYKTLKLID